MKRGQGLLRLVELDMEVKNVTMTANFQSHYNRQREEVLFLDLFLFQLSTILTCQVY